MCACDVGTTLIQHRVHVSCLHTVPSQQTRVIDPMLVQCWLIVYDAGPTLNQHCVDASCVLVRPMWHAIDVTASSAVNSKKRSSWLLYKRSVTALWLIRAMIIIISPDMIWRAEDHKPIIPSFSGHVFPINLWCLSWPSHPMGYTANPGINLYHIKENICYTRPKCSICLL